MRLLSVTLYFFAISSVAFAQSPAAESTNEQRIVGTWTGNSTCVEKNGPCHDEVNVYHISKIPEKTDSFLVTGSKVVDGKEIVMGTAEWTLDSHKHILSWTADRRIITLTIKGDKLEGTLTSHGTLIRKIFLKKEK